MPELNAVKRLTDHAGGNELIDYFRAGRNL